MRCLHCRVEINPSFKEVYLTVDNEHHWSVSHMICPNPKCGKLIVELNAGNGLALGPIGNQIVVPKIQQTIVKPYSANSRPPVPSEVDKPIADDYTEACLVFNVSSKASAALSRRCLQHILIEKAGVNRKEDLSKQIQQVIDGGSLPVHLAESIDAIRNIGNFAAHPLKSTSTGEIVGVEPGEAEWLLDVIEALFDYYFVQPAILKARRDALNAKLQALGKPQMK